MNQNAEKELTQAILLHVEKVGYLCTSKDILYNRTIHELRKEIKRLRALLRFYKNLSRGYSKEIRREIRQFGRLLSPARESYINIVFFEKELNGTVLPSDHGIREAGEKLHQKNRELTRGRFIKENIRENIRAFFTGFELKLEEAGGQKVTDIHVIREVGHSYLKSFSQFQVLHGDFRAEELHSLRKKMKRLYYQLDFMGLLQPGDFEPEREQLDIINDLLGFDHDLHVFSGELFSPEYNLSAEEKLILENQIDRLQEVNHSTLRPRLEHFFTISPEEFDQRLIEYL